MRQRVLDAAAAFGSCVGDDAAAACAALRRAGVGSDVPSAKGGAAARSAGDAWAATLALKWHDSDALPSVRDACDVAAPTAAAALHRDMTDAGARLTAVSAAVAAACDAYVAATHGASPRLADACIAARTAKARLIHYRAGASACDAGRDVPLAALAGWQQWHYDYGLFTALAAPVLRAADGAVVDAATCGAAGLVVLRTTADGAAVPTLVTIPPDAVAVQVGEAAQLLSHGALTATPHCVLRPCSCAAAAAAAARAGGPHPATVSRQILVVFNQPPWDTRLPPPPPPQVAESAAGAATGADAALAALLPRLAARWRPDATFSDFSTATTRAYYSRGGGMQTRGAAPATHS